MVHSHVDLDREAVNTFCRRHAIQRLSLFGSALREDFRPDSDVDLLVEFEPRARVGLFQMVAMEDELSRLIGRRVDLRTAAELSRYFREDVVAGAETLYAA